MPKLLGPLLSVEAHGTAYDLLTYRMIHHQAVVSRPGRSTRPPSAAQLEQRAKVATIAATWRLELEEIREEWRAYAAQFHLSGWSLYWQEYALQGIVWPDSPELPTDAEAGMLPDEPDPED